MTSSRFARPEKHRTYRLDRRDWLRQATALVAGAAGGIRTVTAQQRGGSAYLFPGFKTAKVQTSGATINLVIGGSGPPLLLLHGAPQTHAIWYRVAPDLARDYTVVAADLRGYGDSSKPDGGPNHVNYSKRAMALDQVEVMKHFGFDRFAVVGHDRGARVDPPPGARPSQDGHQSGRARHRADTLPLQPCHTGGGHRVLSLDRYPAPYENFVLV